MPVSRTEAREPRKVKSSIEERKTLVPALSNVSHGVTDTSEARCGKARIRRASGRKCDTDNVAVPQAVGVSPSLTGSQQVSGTSSEKARISAARRCEAGVRGHMATGFPGQAVASAMTSRAGRLGAGW